MNPELAERPLEVIRHRFDKSQLDHFREVTELRKTFEKATMKLVGIGFVVGVLVTSIIWGCFVW